MAPLFFGPLSAFFLALLHEIIHTRRRVETIPHLFDTRVLLATRRTEDGRSGVGALAFLLGGVFELLEFVPHFPAELHKLVGDFGFIQRAVRHDPAIFAVALRNSACSVAVLLLTHTVSRAIRLAFALANWLAPPGGLLFVFHVARVPAAGFRFAEAVRVVIAPIGYLVFPTTTKKVSKRALFVLIFRVGCCCTTVAGAQAIAVGATALVLKARAPQMVLEGFSIDFVQGRFVFRVAVCVYAYLCVVCMCVCLEERVCMCLYIHIYTHMCVCE